MTRTQPVRSAGRPTRTAAYRRRRRSLLFGAGLVALLVATAFSAAAHSITGNARGSGDLTMPHQARTLHTARIQLSAVRWPQRGQAALVVGHRRPAVSPHEQPVTIASVAKVMTAYLVLEHDPLSGTEDGFTVTVTAAQAQAEVQDAREGQSVAAVQAGERLSERQMLEALLIPSGNNIARMLAVEVAGSEPRFVAEMNAEAQALGMDHTTYTDPSGLDRGTISTAADQLRIFRQAMRFPVFRQIVSMASVTLPVAGTLTNTNPLIAEGYAGKTGSDSGAGACLAFFTHVTVGGHRQTAVGVVLGQWEHGDPSVVLAAAGRAAEQLVHSVAATSGRTIVAAPGGTGGRRGSAGGRRRLPPRSGHPSG